MTCAQRSKPKPTSLHAVRLAYALNTKKVLVLLQIYPMIGFEWTAKQFFWCVLLNDTQVHCVMRAHDRRCLNGKALHLQVCSTRLATV